jgi:hypothetical protein
MGKSAARFVAFGVAACLGSFAQAADHGDPPGLTGTAPAITADQDIADIYAWRPDSTNLAVAITFSRNVAVGSTFDSSFIYRVVINRSSGGTDAGMDTDIRCVFEKTDNTSLACYFSSDGGATLTVYRGNPLSEQGFTSNGVQIAALVRNDPFNFNLTGFNGTQAFVVANAGGLTFDTHGCPDLTANVGGQSLAARIVACVQSKCDGNVETGPQSPAADDFRGQNVKALIFRIPLDHLSGNGNNLKLSAFTHAKPAA